MKLPTIMTAICLALLLPMPSMAELPAGSIVFDGETYIVQQDRDENYVRTAEFVRPQEDLATWTRLISIRHYPRLMTPRTAVAHVALELVKSNPGLVYEVAVADNNSEAVLKFTTRTVDGASTEVNAWRFMKKDGYSGVVSYQFTQKVPAVSVMQAGLTNQDWLRELAGANFDYRFARLGKEAKLYRP